jgi:hypothetical protein
MVCFPGFPRQGWGVSALFLHETFTAGFDEASHCMSGSELGLFFKL